MERMSRHWLHFICLLVTLPVHSGCVWGVAGPDEGGGSTVSDLRCEYRSAPLGVDTEKPRFCWKLSSQQRGLQQTAYRILVASSKSQLEFNKADMWDSGKVATDQSTHIRYAGRALTSGGRYYWKVRVWDQDGLVSAYSEPTWFEMALLSSADWAASWIEPTNEPPVVEQWRVKLNNLPPHPVPGCALLDFDDSAWQVLQAHTLYDKYGADHHSKTGDPLETQVGYAWYRTNIHAEKDVGGKLFPRLLYFRKALQNVWVFINGELVIQTADDINFAFYIAPHLKEGENFVALCIQRTNPHEHHPGGLRTKVKMGIKDNLLRKSFRLNKKIANARVYVSGLGYYELRINGEKIGDHELDPGWTDYKKSTIYSTYDVTKLLKTGDNAIGMMLGHGHYAGFGLSYGNSIRMILQMNISFADGSQMQVVSDDSWKTVSGPILADHIFHGETYDARLERPGWDNPGYDDSDWNSARKVESTEAILKSQYVQPIKVIQTITPVKMTNPKEGVFVFDLGQNIAGWVRLKVKGVAGTRITLKHTELLKADGTADQTNIIASAMATDYYILKGKGEELWQPRFTYHGFRYVEMTGYPGVPTTDSIEGIVVHSDIPWSGQFTCSNDLINRIQNMITWSVRDNFHSVPGSCCNRGERAGWGGDVQVMIPTTYYNFDMANLYYKFMEDYAEDQNPEGGVHDSIPWTGWGGYSAPGWHDCYTILAWTLYQYYGDSDIIRKHYARLKLALNYILADNPDLIWENNVGGNYGDWGAPINDEELKKLLATCNFYQDAIFMSRMAKVMGESNDARSYAGLANRIKRAINKKFFNSETNQYGAGAQAGNAFPLFLGIVPKGHKTAVAENLVKDVKDRGFHQTTGPQGTRYLMLALTMNGHTDVAYKLATQTTQPSWGYMIANGATTLWEFWGGGNHISHNHPFLGSVGEWFYKVLAGIQLEPTGPGFKRFTIKPQIAGDLTWVKGSYDSIYGAIVSDWKRKGNTLILNVTIPGNTTAKVFVPVLGNENATITESGTELYRNERSSGNINGVRFSHREDDCAVFAVGSGSYRFAVKMN